MTESKNNRGNILGIYIDPVNIQKTVDIINTWIQSRKSNYVCVTPAHSVMQGYRNPELRKIFNQSGLTTPDGMAIVWILRLQGFPDVDRVYGPDLMQAVCQYSSKVGWRHYFYGGEPGVAEQLSEKLISQYPGLTIAGLYSPPFRELTLEDDREIITMINRAYPDIVWVGIGSPKQEQWMHEHLGKLNAPVLIGVGAAFDFLSGRKTQAPRWIQRSGFEWLFRLASEPRRLWRRYADYPLFVILVMLQCFHLKHFPSD
jgi:N-acetylglucosaminyldiphosphoundecaprenol N-acetyl-beta-D-mannosaminyltransferase